MNDGGKSMRSRVRGSGANRYRKPVHSVRYDEEFRYNNGIWHVLEEDSVVRNGYHFVHIKNRHGQTEWIDWIKGRYERLLMGIFE